MNRPVTVELSGYGSSLRGFGSLSGPPSSGQGQAIYNYAKQQASGASPFEIWVGRIGADAALKRLMEIAAGFVQFQGWGTNILVEVRTA